MNQLKCVKVKPEKAIAGTEEWEELRILHLTTRGITVFSIFYEWKMYEWKMCDFCADLLA